MGKSVKDEIVEEIRRVREEHAARFDYKSMPSMRI
jgi:hypothetical protein